jgi:hypothetical protein
LLYPCHHKNLQNNLGAGRSARLAVPVILFIVALGHGKDAAAPSGTGTAPAASLSLSSLAFANQPVSSTSAAKTLTLSNTGNGALSVSSLKLTGANVSDFAETNTCGASVAAGAKCKISVTFSPSASGSFTAAVTFTDDAAGSPQTVSLTGTGTAPLVSLSPSSLSFGNEPVDTTSSPQVVTLNNTGNVALSITRLAFTGADAGDFTENDTCSSSVAMGGDCTIAISFTPSATRTRVASLTIVDNATGSPQSAPLSGMGTHDVVLSWDPSTIPGVSGYNVFRGTTPGGENVTPLNSTPISGTTYTDASVTAGATYYYVVAAIASDNVTPAVDSNEASATVPSP